LRLRTAAGTGLAVAVRGRVSSPAATPSATGPVDLTPAFAGDVHFTGRTRGCSQPQTTFGPMAPALWDADFAMVNLETAVTSRYRPKTHFRAPVDPRGAVGGRVDAVDRQQPHA
jgi:poly-gamma-glutamate synthesis protein (capsule biosynthesis protein)